MSSEPCVFLVDDDFAVRDSLKLVIEAAGFVCRTFESAEHFLESFCPGNIGVLLLDVNMPGLDGQELQAELSRRHIHLPIIFLTAHGDIPMTVRVIKAGALDFLTKPVSSELLIKRVREALQQEVEMHAKTMEEQALCRRLSGLTAREMEVMTWVVSGLANKEIARKLDISHRTVEIHRARVMEKTGAANLLELAHICETCRLCLDPPFEST
ncbi:response regulator transcription factor [Methylomonas sp. LL1]|uniref:response regulator transcription factor n=1 Tax=Methylomonas sp. LL1 TaxID=2785785 RepID=UPI0018C3B55C|nr:response regulator [Methylomonas sp. LL1]QPK63611.1 response regulator transcription factor [Methylomonas sp. LL1]